MYSTLGMTSLRCIKYFIYYIGTSYIFYRIIQFTFIRYTTDWATGQQIGQIKVSGPLFDLFYLFNILQHFSYFKQFLK